jgi:NTP pyrophosphatase (non-canonical NTP hydrolase)
MNPNQSYNQFVASLAKPGKEIVESMTHEDAHMMHMAIGVSGEAGELLDAIKKAVIYRKPLDFLNVKEEAGDILFYLTGLLGQLGMSIDECIEENRRKLSKRYALGRYSNDQAVTRADKQNEAICHSRIADDIDNDLADVKVERTCRIDDPDCESCQ